MRKSTWLAAIATALILTVTPPANASVNVQLNGQPLLFDVPPVNENGRTLVPVRAIFEALGARITWDPASQTISAVHPEREKYVILKLGSTTAWVDGEQVTLDLAPKSIDGRTMVPLRFISTAMGAEVTWDAATETVIIEQEPLARPEEPPVPVEPTPSEEAEEEPAENSDFVDESMGETPSAELSNAQLLSRFTRSVAYTHLEETWWCALGMEYRFEEMEYIFVENDSAFLEEVLPRLDESVSCWAEYEQEILPALPAPAGSEAAREALQRWIDLNQNALDQLQWALDAHLKGDTAERNRLVQEGHQVLEAAFQQEQTMLAAMNAITSSDPQFLTPAEHQYVAWLDDMMGLTDNCFSELRMIYHLEDADEAFWTKAGADCMVELPEILSEKTPPTPRMEALFKGAMTELAAHTENFTALAAKVEAGEVESAALAAEIEVIGETWYEALPTWDQLFVYRDYGKF